MFAVIVYFWRMWRDTFFRSSAAFKKFAGLLILATGLTGVVGETIIKIIEKTRVMGGDDGSTPISFSATIT
jgi:undecaprenyl-diphosphatase